MATDLWNELPESTGEFEQKSKYTPIPKGTIVTAHIEEAKNDGFPGSSHLNPNLKWCVDEPQEYKGRTFYQSLPTNGTDPSGQYYKADAQRDIMADAINMILAIDKNCGGNIGVLRRKPTSEELTKHLVGGSMKLLLGVSKKDKNFVEKVFANTAQQAPAKKEAPKAKPAAYGDDDPDLIPF